MSVLGIIDGLASKRRAGWIVFGVLCLMVLSGHPARAEGDEGENPSLIPSAPLNEQIVMLPGDQTRPVLLETTIFRPPGPGPFPLAVMLHGATNASAANRGDRYRYTFSAYYFLSRGYEVAMPMARGFAKSGGSLARHGCAIFNTGLENAADIAAAITALQQRPEVDRTRVVIAGQSFGGWTAMAYGTLHGPGVRGLIGFSPAFRESDCTDQDQAMVNGMGRFGSGAGLPALWFYGTNDSVVPVATWRGMYDAFRRSGGRVQLVQIGHVGTDSHQVLSSSENFHLWVPPTDAFLAQIGLPSAETHPEYLPSLPPPPSHFAAIDDVNALPLADPKYRDAYRQFLTRALPRAFVIAPGRVVSTANGGFDPLARASAACVKAGVVCVPYAIDNDVVWVPPSIQTVSVTKTIVAGHLASLAFATAVNADCSPKAGPALHVLNGPAHGTAAIQPATGHPQFAPNNPLAVCNQAVVPGAAVTYLPAPGYSGADTLTFEEVSSDGTHHPFRISLLVQ